VQHKVGDKVERAYQRGGPAQEGFMLPRAGTSLQLAGGGEGDVVQCAAGFDSD